ncbi:hypothetical protein [Roseovarius indicus]|uniref:hypothetical protein n=1 Tax=Roseovarius indicus TaxID=540747 RepID=UPI0010FDF91B|nr:hypothetical protein [Roseovarius indicus]
MSRYQQLREAYANYQDFERQFVEENRVLARLLTQGLQEFLEMPQSYTIPAGTGSRRDLYIKYYSLDEEGERSKEAVSLHEAITHLTDGSFRFAFGISLERQEGSFPKFDIILRVDCKRNNHNVDVDVSGAKTTCIFDGNHSPDMEKVHELVFDLLMGWLRRRPHEENDFSKVGFTLS